MRGRIHKPTRYMGWYPSRTASAPKPPLSLPSRPPGDYLRFGRTPTCFRPPRRGTRLSWPLPWSRLSMARLSAALPKTVTRNRPIAHRSMRFAHRIHVGTLPVPPAPQNPPFPSPPAPPATTCVLAGLLLAFVPPVGAPGSHGHYHGQGCRWPGFLQHYLTNTPQDTRQQPPRALCSTGKLIRG